MNIYHTIIIKMNNNNNNNKKYQKKFQKEPKNYKITFNNQKQVKDLILQTINHKFNNNKLINNNNKHFKDKTLLITFYNYLKTVKVPTKIIIIIITIKKTP